jgi:hypothetical protein
MVIHDSTFDANTAGLVSGGVVISRIFLIFLLCLGGGHATTFEWLLLLQIFSDCNTNWAQYYGVSFSFHLHYFSALSEKFLRKELSQFFAPIPGGAHGTISNGRRSVIFSRIIANFDAVGKSKRKL